MLESMSDGSQTVTIVLSATTTGNISSMFSKMSPTKSPRY